MTVFLCHPVEQGSGTYGSRARCGSFDDSIWLTWYFINTIVVIFYQTNLVWYLPDQGGPRLQAWRATLWFEETFAGHKETNFTAIKRFVCCSNRPNFAARLTQFLIK